MEKQLVEEMGLSSDGTCLAYSYYDEDGERWVEFIDLEDPDEYIDIGNGDADVAALENG